MLCYTLRPTKVAFDLNRTSYIGIGLMCGTSLDALDVLITHLYQEERHWDYSILKSHTQPLPTILKNRLARANDLSALEYVRLDRDVAIFCAETVNNIKDSIAIDFIASHGITIFHQPQNGITTQIGSGGIIAAITGIKTISDFRIQDVTKGGQGAPLVPYIDKLLFNQYDAAINLGGFANISILNEQHLKGFDICPCNKPLNHLYALTGLPGEFDKDGKCTSTGAIDYNLLSRLNQLPYYSEKQPKSLGQEWFLKHLKPIIDSYENPIDALRTVTEHISIQIANELPGEGKVLLTGGGAFNSFLVDRIRKLTEAECIVPSPQLIEFKESLAFALLGALRLNQATNIDKNVTGASADTSAGAIYLP